CDVPLPFDDTHAAPFGLNARPHAFNRCGSVSAAPGRFEALFSCVTNPSIAACPCAFAISASIIVCADPGCPAPGCPGVVVCGGLVVVALLPHPIAAAATPSPKKRTHLMCP